jgi:hypothetical protein
MSAHTPGPWIHYDDSADGKTNRHEIQARGKTIAHIYWSVPDQDKANARLIAAAPDLYEALRRAVEWADANKQRAGTLDVTGMRTALAKASL